MFGALREHNMCYHHPLLGEKTYFKPPTRDWCLPYTCYIPIIISLIHYWDGSSLIPIIPMKMIKAQHQKHNSPFLPLKNPGSCWLSLPFLISQVPKTALFWALTSDSSRSFCSCLSRRFCASSSTEATHWVNITRLQRPNKKRPSIGQCLPTYQKLIETKTPWMSAIFLEFPFCPVHIVATFACWRVAILVILALEHRDQALNQAPTGCPSHLQVFVVEDQMPLHFVIPGTCT